MTRPTGRRRLIVVALFAFVWLVTGQTSVARPDPAPPVLVVAQGLSDTTVELQWMAADAAESYVVHRDGNFLTSSPGTIYDDTTVSPLTTHSYQVSSVVAGQESVPSDPVSATAQAPRDATPPTQPGSITVSGIQSNSATLKWKKSTDNVAVLGYRILRGAPGAPLDQLVQVDTAEDSSVSYTAKPLKDDTSYQFALLAIDAGGNQSVARTTTFTTSHSNDSTAPAAPSSGSVSISAFSSTRIDVIWGASSSSDVAGYELFRDGVRIAGIDVPLRRTYSDNGLAPGSTHNYQLRAFDSAGNISSLTTGRTATTRADGFVQIVRGPYLQWATTDSIRIAWWTNIPAPSMVSYGTTGLTSQVVDSVMTLQHVMLVGGLIAGTTYMYQVTSGGATSATSSFVTAAPPGATFSFAGVGDYGGGSAQETSIANLIAASNVQYIQTLGDNVYPDSRDPDFATVYSDFDSRFYKPYKSAIASKPIWAGGGNHEYYSGDDSFWRNFWMPNNERWFSYDWGDAHILVLDTEQPFTQGTPQYQFAQSDLAASQSAVWRIVVFHRPAYSSLSNASSSEPVQDNLVPLFELYKVQLVLNGHSHNYERTYPLVGGVRQDGGVTYIVSGGGGNGINQFKGNQPSWSAFRAASYEYVKVTVSPASLRLEAISDGNVLLDSTTITADGSPPGAISGTVTDASTTAPLAGATVAYSAGSATTDASGAYTIQGVAAGTYVVTATAVNYTPQTTPATVSAGQTTQLDFALAPGQHTAVFTDGFESGALSAWTSSAGLVVETALVHSGTYAAEGNTTNGNTLAKKTLPSTYTDAYARTYFNVLSASSQVNLLRLKTATDASIGYLFVNTSNKLGLRADAAATTYTSTTLVGAGWHSLELHAVIAGSSSTTEVWLDGILIGDVSITTDLGSTPVGRFQIGEAQTGRTYDVVFDDAVFDTQPIGP